MLIKNVKGSSKISPNPPSGYRSWLNYWELNFGQILEVGKQYECPACHNYFYRSNFDGCHVQKVGYIDNKWYIIPLCDSCNHRIDNPEVDDNLLIDVPSNLNVTHLV